MSLLNEYIQKMREGWGTIQLEDELQKLISNYNKQRDTYLFRTCRQVQRCIFSFSLLNNAK